MATEVLFFFRDTNFRFLLLGFSRRIVGIPELFCSFYTAAFRIYSFDLMISARVTCRFIHTLSNIKRDSFTLFL